jgi:hypothetical protein
VKRKRREREREKKKKVRKNNIDLQNRIEVPRDLIALDTSFILFYQQVENIE